MRPERAQPLSAFNATHLAGWRIQPAGASDTAFRDRSAPFLLGIESNWEYPEDDDAALECGRAAFRALEPFATGAEYMNSRDCTRTTIRWSTAPSGANLDRFVALKQ